MALPLVAFGLIALAAISFFLVGFERSYSGFSNQYVVDQARQAYKQNKFDDAATFLERMALNHKLDDEQSTLLNDVYLARSAQRLQRLDYAGAMSDLNKISPRYSKFPVVSTRKTELNQLINQTQAQQQAQLALAAKNSARADKSRTRQSSKSTPAQNSAGATLSQAPNAISTTSASESLTSASQSSNRLSTDSTSARVSIVSSSGLPVRSAAADASVHTGGDAPSTSESSLVRPDGESSRSAPPAQKGNARSKAAKITENDQVRYNELLAGYFSQEHKQSAGAMEPPSLKEWIDSGRPKF